eukprot:scaffold48213_cov68-Phaeocystis_antarctica.AAC.5
MAPALPAHARHQSPRAELRISRAIPSGLVAIPSTDRIDLAADRGKPKCMPCSGHPGQRLPAIGLRVVHLRRVERMTGVPTAARDVELAIESDAAVREA